jgi:para-nitrobenzyl esterase
MEPVVDGEVLPDFPLNAVKTGSAKGVTVMAGGNLNEGTLFALPVPGIAKLDEEGLRKRLAFMVPEKRVKDVIEAYRTALSKRNFTPTPTDIYIAIQGDKQFRMPNIRLVEIQRNLGFPGYSYVFDWKCAVPELGACHALDVGFVFGATYKEFHGSGPSVNKLAQGIQEAWTAFARTGNPNSPTMGEWPPYGKNRNTMILGANSHIEAAPYEEERAAWDGIDNEYLG